ncbi:hypothetical protein [Sphingomonas soli]|uniref:hypothetical protein n=1 Tax=Sphingomonas soli TaxID=266127 RepID=UPI00082B501C|nr:hypothetical protein [Sphingomonas soli]
MQRSNVVPRVQPLTEQQFRSKWLRALSRLCDQHGDGQVALWLGVGDRQLRNIKSGASLPTADKIWNLLAWDDSAHDELDREYGLKNVGADAICTSDPLTIDLIALAHETAQAEAPDSPGGTATTDHELLLKDEGRLRKCYRTLGTWLARIEEIRRPALRRVS